MRRRTLFGWGLAGVVAATGSTFAQTPPPAAPPAAQPPQHEWMVQPPHGKWMICVKSYSGPMAKSLAEDLARDIRTTYKVAAYLTERGSAERKEQEAHIARERERQKAEQAQFLTMSNRLREEALAKGIEFVESPPKIKVPRVNIEEQWAVLIGGWPDMATARRQLDVVRAWPPPKDQKLMDQAFAARRGKDGQGAGEMTYLNPFQLGMVVPNPTAPKTPEDDGLDKVLIKLNAEEPMSVLKIKKEWTLVVKAYHPPRRKLEDREASKSVVQRLFGGDDGKEMQAMAASAAEFAKALRHPNFKPRPVDSYLFHTLYGTLVCVGEFDGPGDPTMMQVKKELESVTYLIKRGDQFEAARTPLFDATMFPIQVPRAK